MVKPYIRGKILYQELIIFSDTDMDELNSYMSKGRGKGKIKLSKDIKVIKNKIDKASGLLDLISKTEKVIEKVKKNSKRKDTTIKYTVLLRIEVISPEQYPNGATLLATPGDTIIKTTTDKVNSVKKLWIKKQTV